ncbi:MAG: hypothetical protein USCAAHI_02524 [Beijerinckiaceae bacterium]|nr:MAG: hypothetical protein USCAAHI_02524 [Beijerinckiaceae bacterium]
MDTKRMSLVSGAALLALTGTASAGPMSVASSEVVAPPQPQIERLATTGILTDITRIIITINWGDQGRTP